MGELRTVRALASAAIALGATRVGVLTAAEKRLAQDASPPAARAVATLVDAIRAGEDPLGDALCVVRSPDERRATGTTLTPTPVVRAMLDGVDGDIARVVDPGAGTGRLLLAAADRCPAAWLVGVERDPLAALLLRAGLAARGLERRAVVLVRDYLRLRLPPRARRTLFIANPPYVRHHGIPAITKRWLVDAAASHGVQGASRRAGLHVHFLLATLLAARPGDLGVFLMPAEWLDVNYGRLVRALLAGPLGGTEVRVIEPRTRAFPGVMTTATLSRFEVGARTETLRIALAKEVAGTASHVADVPRAELARAPRWSAFVRASRPWASRLPAEGDGIALGELCSVHRGAVTACNAIFIVDAARGPSDVPEPFLVPAVTRARELFAAGDVLADTRGLRRVIHIPHTLDGFDTVTRAHLERFLERARLAGVDKTYVARARRSWWTVALRPPAPILATYMARRPPAFVRNVAGVVHVNVAHGLYPKVALSSLQLDALARHLRDAVSTYEGRTYAGGLTKFEPREMERLRIPRAVLECGGLQEAGFGR